MLLQERRRMRCFKRENNLWEKETRVTNEAEKLEVNRWLDLKAPRVWETKNSHELCRILAILLMQVMSRFR